MNNLKDSIKTNVRQHSGGVVEISVGVMISRLFDEEGNATQIILNEVIGFISKEIGKKFIEKHELEVLEKITPAAVATMAVVEAAKDFRKKEYI